MTDPQEQAQGPDEGVNEGVCPWCGVFVSFERIGDTSIAQRDRHDNVYALRCTRPRCREVSVVLERGREWARYPAPRPPDVPGVPENVMGVYREAVIALQAGAPRAAACMIRRCVASAATDQGVPDEDGGNWLPLQVRVDRLKDKLLPATYAAARAARLLGDAGAHEEAEDRLGEIDAATVAKTITVVRQFLGNLYELPEEIKELGMEAESGEP